MGWHMGNAGWGAGLMVLAWAVFWIALVAGVVVLVLKGRTTTAAPEPARVLAERLARGEISEEEYRSRLAVLRDAGTGATPPTGRSGE